MLALLASSVLLSAAATFPPSAAAASPAAPAVTVDVSLPSGVGTIRGFQLDADWVAFRGVPYAAPPTGNNRWQPPQPVQPWKPTVLSTAAFKPNCLQPSAAEGGDWWYSINDADASSEDCLYVDVYVPVKSGILDRHGNAGNSTGNAEKSTEKAAASSTLSTLLWIHGGDYQAGGSNDGETVKPPSAHLSDNGVIYVSVNYRLGVFG